MEIDFKIIALRAVGVVLAVPAPGLPPAGCQGRFRIVTVKAICQQDAIRGLLHAWRNQQVDIAHIAHAGVGIDALRGTERP